MSLLFLFLGSVACVWGCSAMSSLCDPMDCSPPGSSVHGILQARIPEWVILGKEMDLPSPGIELSSPALTGRSFTTEPPGTPLWDHSTAIYWRTPISVSMTNKYSKQENIQCLHSRNIPLPWGSASTPWHNPWPCVSVLITGLWFFRLDSTYALYHFCK